jgi:hypothetical protein
MVREVEVSDAEAKRFEQDLELGVADVAATARPQRGAIVCGVDGSAHARLAAKAAYPRSVEVAEVQATESFGSLSSELDLALEKQRTA